MIRRFLHQLGSHHWSEWGDPYTGIGNYGWLFGQSRRCLICNIRQERLVH